MAELTRRNRIEWLENAAVWVGIFLSGFAGLVQETAWHRYMGILLGTQARATLVVLSIFLLGMTGGYFLFGKISRHSKREIVRYYLLVEVALAGWAILFPLLFKGMWHLMPWLYKIFGLNTPGADILAAALLIAPPSILFGATLPLLTAFLSENVVNASSTHARLYSVNSLGAAVGSWGCGYLLLPNLHLSNVMVVAAAGNLLVAGLFLRLLKVRYPLHKEKMENVFGDAPSRSVPLFPLWLAFSAGLTVLVLESVLIRFVGLSIGSAEHHFSLIVGIVILGIAAGASFCRRYFTHRGFQTLLWAHFIAFAGFFLVYLTLNSWPYLGHVVRVLFRDLAFNFYLYQILAGLFFAGLLIVPFAATGAILPLCFHVLKDQRSRLGYRVGQLYAANGFGCAAGAWVGYFGLRLFNLDRLYEFTLGVFIFNVGLLCFHCWTEETFVERRRKIVVAAIGVAVMNLILLQPIDRRSQLQAFRYPNAIDATFQGKEAFYSYLAKSTEIIYHKDDPDMSMMISKNQVGGIEGSRTLFVNGKSDGNTKGDLFTTLMLAHVPGLLAPKLKQIAVVGLGTGITTGAFRLYPEVESVDVVELSESVVKNRELFDAYNLGLSKYDKAHYYSMDAFRFFLGTQKTYNVIVSEPSNPWVAGVENLFSSEFYEIVARHLEKDGLFVQWIHGYSFNDSLFRMVVRTLTEELPYVSVYQLKGGDLALVASKTRIGRTHLNKVYSRFNEYPAVRASLHEVGITSLEAFLALEIIPPATVSAMAQMARINEVENPKLSHAAAKAFFLQTSSKPYELRRRYSEFYRNLDESLLAMHTGKRAMNERELNIFRTTFCENPASFCAFLCEEALVASRLASPKFVMKSVHQGMVGARDLATVDKARSGVIGKITQTSLDETYELLELYRKYASPMVAVDTRLLNARVNRCFAEVGKDTELFGECLLQKILNMQIYPNEKEELSVVAEDFFHWFEKLSPKSAQFGKFKEARRMLVQLLEQ